MSPIPDWNNRTGIGLLAHVLWVVCIVFFLVASGAAQAEISLNFGTYTTDKPTYVVRKFRPILELLSDELTLRLGEPVTIRMKVAQDYNAGISDLITGRVDFARFGPASYIVAKAENPGIEILAMETKKGKKVFKGVIIVQEQSDIATLADLKGRRFAFGSRLSTIGRFLAQEQLLKAGISATELAGYEYLERHDLVGVAVGSGEFDAGALKQSTFKKLADQGVPIRILVEFDNITKPWLSRSGLNPRIANALRAILLAPDNKDAVTEFTKTGFVLGSDGDFQPIRDAMAISSHFGD